MTVMQAKGRQDIHLPDICGTKNQVCKLGHFSENDLILGPQISTDGYLYDTANPVNEQLPVRAMWC